MVRGRNNDDPTELSQPPDGPFSRFRRSRDPEQIPLGDRMRTAFLKPPKPGTEVESKPAGPKSVEELEWIAHNADDKERLIGLLAAPIAAAIAIVVSTVLITDDPAPLKNGQVNKLHVPIGTYHTLEIVLLGMSIVILASAFFRKRLYLGIALALFGLGIFNLHYWGFGIPFIMGAAWYLVRSYRFQRELKEAKGEGPSTSDSRTFSGRPRQSKRYTPPSSSSRNYRN